VRSLEDLIARPQSGPLNGGSSGTGSPPHLGLELLRRLTKAPQNVVHAPYRGGAPSLTDLMGGSLDFIMSNLPECLPHIQSGRLRGLAVTSETRHPLLPDVPTVAELNRPGLLITNWTGLAVPSAVPGPLLTRIGRDVTTAMADPGTRQKAEAGGFALVVSKPEEAQAFAMAEVARWRTLITEAEIKAE
jgi:tripartite-type tricarboxylate transporter receptor subunit TctC